AACHADKWSEYSGMPRVLVFQLTLVNHLFNFEADINGELFIGIHVEADVSAIGRNELISFHEAREHQNGAKPVIARWLISLRKDAPAAFSLQKRISEKHTPPCGGWSRCDRSLNSRQQHTRFFG